MAWLQQRSWPRILMLTAAWLMLLVTVVLFCVGAVALDMDFYVTQFEKWKVPLDSEMSIEGLERTSRVLMDYFLGRRDDIVCYEEIGGVEREVFNEKEKLHNEDVRGLFRSGLKIVIAGWVLAAGCVAAGVLVWKKDFWRAFAKSFFIALAVFVLVLGALGIAFAVDFYDMFYLFHEICFDNDLWLMDYRTDFIILMFPEPFFYAATMRVLLYAGCALGALAAWMGITLWRTKHHGV